MMLVGVTEAKAALRKRLATLPLPNWVPMLQNFLALPELEKASTVLLFHGMEREPDTRSTIVRLLEEGKTVALPHCLPGRMLEARQITSLEDLRLGTWGIAEPGKDCPVIERDKIDLILVPCLCCDRLGYRLGHGAGYYDRYLPGYVGFTVALCPDEWLQDKLPRDSFDVPVQLVLTEKEAWRGV